MKYALALGVGVHQFFELSGALDLEEDLLTILSKGVLTWLLTLRLSCSEFVAVASVITSNDYIDC